MAIPIEMPKLSDTMSEGKILSWKKREGEAVKAGEVLVEIESDKANMEMEAYDTGYVRKIVVPAGGSAPIGALIAVITERADEDISAFLAKAQASAGAGAHGGHAEEKKPAAAVPASRPATVAAAPAASSAVPSRAASSASRGSNGDSAIGYRERKSEGRIIASPLASRMAAELGLDLAGIHGTGPAGRIVKRDIDEAARTQPRGAASTASSTTKPAQQGAPYRLPELTGVPAQSYEDIPVSSMRRIIGQRLTESTTTAPHFFLTVEVNMKPAIEAREQLNRIAGVSITYNDLVVKAVAICLGRHPGLNASWQGDFVRHYKSVDIGVAVALPDGLLTPVVRACQLKTLGRISEEVKDLVERAKTKKLTPDDYKGGTFTVSNLGMFGVKHFTAIINPPEACILAVSAIEDVPVVENGAVVPGHRMSLTLSSDHRVVDGALAAQFMRDLKQILESPISLSL